MRGKRAPRGPTQKPQSFDLRASDAKITESEDFGTLAIVTLKGKGQSLGLEIGQFLGEPVRLFTADRSRTIDGRLLEVRLKIAKDDSIEIQAKVSGTKKMGDFVGTSVALENLQIHLPIVDGKSAAAGERLAMDLGAEPPPAAFDPGPLCSTCDHPWAWVKMETAGARITMDKQTLKVLKVNGHQRKSGKCFVTGCKCEAFMP